MSIDIKTLPPLLVQRVEPYWQDFLRQAPAQLVSALDSQTVAQLPRVWAGSEFVAKQCIANPAMLATLAQSGLHKAYGQGELAGIVAHDLSGVSDEAGLISCLRTLKTREQVRIIWRDLAGSADLIEVTADCSELADAFIRATADLVYRWQCEQLGTPTDAEGKPVSLVVLAMGKLGAHELNVSSDIDLIFAYRENGETRGGTRSISNEEFFTRMGRSFLRVLGDKIGALIYRVDMRLRPFGESGPLAISFDAMEHYYQVHGREWERYAMIKARAVCGDTDDIRDMAQRARPFIYRRYLDYGSFENLREMKQMIMQEVKRKGLSGNIKLGPGGIREVEFIGQAFQLIRGGREPRLQERRILEILHILVDLKILPDYVSRELAEAYLFLRTTEHRLQEVEDKQTHDLPQDELGRARLAFSMGYADWPAFDKVLQQHMRRVHGHFEQVFAAPQSEEGDNDESAAVRIWRSEEGEGATVEWFKALGYDDCQEADRILSQFKNNARIRTLTTRARERMDRLMPLLLGAVPAQGDPTSTLKRMLHLIEQVARRSVYLALLVENPLGLSQLVRLCAASPWLADYLARTPVLLDELLDVRSLYAPADRRQLAQELARRLEGVDQDDLEQQMEVLRHFKQVNVLRVAAADIMEQLPLMQVSDHLTWIAEAVLEQATRLAWLSLAHRHGVPPEVREAGQVDQVSGFAVLAYGKLGGIELGYGSDLDLVFLHQPQEGVTDGDKPLDVNMFYIRLAQRLIHMLNTVTPSGILYEVDLRLRPSGASGLLVSNLEAFAQYQREKAWTWEHQALARARYITGDAAIQGWFEALRAEVLTRDRDQETLRKEVLEMRERMREQLSQDRDDGAEGQFDLKQGRGGIADIEFMVQYCVLAQAHRFADLTQYSDNSRQLEAIHRHQVLPGDEALFLIDAYRSLRARIHRLVLQEGKALDSAGEFAELRVRVRAIWQRVMVAE